MKNQRTKQTVNSFVEKEIKKLKEVSKKSKKRYKWMAVILGIINLIMIGTAAAGIELLVIYDRHHPGSSNTSLILASAASGIIIIMFIIQFVISIYRSVMKQDVYKDAMDAIQVEVMKHNSGIAPYTKKDKTDLLEETCGKLKQHAIDHKHSKKTTSLVLKGLIGGDDA